MPSLRVEMGNPSHKRAHRAATGEILDHQGLGAQFGFMMKVVVAHAVNRSSRHSDYEGCP